MSTLLKLDQTTPQTVINGIPTFSSGVKLNNMLKGQIAFLNHDDWGADDKLLMGSADFFWDDNFKQLAIGGLGLFPSTTVQFFSAKNSINYFVMSCASNTASSQPYFRLQRARGTHTTLASAVANDGIGGLTFRAYEKVVSAGQYHELSVIKAVVESNFTSGGAFANGYGALQFSTRGGTVNAAIDTRWTITSAGYFVSGTNGTGVYNITTAGTVQCAKALTPEIKTDTTTATDLTITTGTAKTILLGTVVYDDLRITPAGFDRAGVADPSLVSYTPSGSGLATFLYEFQKDDIGYFTVQLPHTYKTGTDITVHVHWTAGANGTTENGRTVGWKVDYTWANINGTFSAMATADLSDATDNANHKHQMTPEVTITGTDKNISSMLLCNIKRTDTGTDDTWVGTASGALPMLLEIDFHYAIDTIGSRTISSK